MGLIATETNGEPQDTETLYRAHGAAVGRLCRSLLRDRGEAEDATQQVFLSVHRALLNGAAPRDPLPWLLTVARNECYSRFRQRAAAPAPSDAADGVAADASVHVLRAGELADMWDEVGRLPTAQREAFLLREIRGLSYGQLADELALTPPSVRSLLLRARARLRRRLGDAVAGLGSLQWIQTLFRLVAGSESAAPVHVAARAAALGIGALTLAGGGGLAAHHLTRRAGPATAPSRPRAAHVNRDAVVEPAVAVPSENGAGPSAHESRPARSVRDGGSASARPERHARSGGDRAGSSESSGGGGGGSDTSSGRSSAGSGRDGSDDAASSSPQTRDGGGGEGGRDSTSGSGQGSGSSSGSSEGGSSAGSSSGSDGGSEGTSTVASPGSGSDSGPGDGGDGGSDGSGVSGGGGGSDGGTSVDG